MLEIKPFSPHDLSLLDAREPDKSILASLADPLEYAEFYNRKGPAYTAWIDEVPIACAGIVIFWRGVGEAWALTTPHVAKFPCAFHRVFRHKLADLLEEFELRRVQVCIPRSHKTSRKWIIKLGFHRESAMPQYGPDGTEPDYVRYALVRPPCHHS